LGFTIELEAVMTDGKKGVGKTDEPGPTKQELDDKELDQVQGGTATYAGNTGGGNQQAAAVSSLRTLVTAQPLFRDGDKDGDG